MANDKEINFDGFPDVPESDEQIYLDLLKNEAEAESGGSISVAELRCKIQQWRTESKLQSQLSDTSKP